MNVSVVVPTYNRRPVLEQTVRCLLEQDCLETCYEIVVVDDQSTDDTSEWLREARAQHEQLVAVSSPDKGRGQARNAGIKAARGEIICFVDDDVWVTPHFVAAHWHAHQKHGPKAVIIGKLEVCPRTAKTLANDYDDARLVRVERRIQAAGEDLDAGFLRTGNVSVQRSLLLEVGGFDESFHGYSYEDSELGYRLMANGGRFRYAPDAAGAHHTDATVAEILRKRREAGRSAVTFLRRWPEAAGNVPAPYSIPGVSTTLRRDTLMKTLAKELILSGTAELVVRGLLSATLRFDHRRGSFALLDLLGWIKYSRAFREAAIELGSSR